jgi:enoyl-CoA hydratase/carnithine racemase
MITRERHKEHVLKIGLNRAAKRNGFTREMLTDLALAYAELHGDASLRCGVLHAHGDHFTAGLDLASFGTGLLEDPLALAPGADGIDPLRLHGEPCRKPVIVAVQGICFTIGIELMLAADIRIAAPGARFSQLEIARGLYPLCGATFRMPEQCGWGNAQRWLLTGDEFDAAEAYRIGLVQEIAADPLARALEIADRIADQAPLGVQASLASSRTGRVDDWRKQIAASDDLQEGICSFRERRPARFTGK